MRPQTKIALGSLGVIVALVVVLVAINRGDNDEPAPTANSPQNSLLLRDNSRVMGEPGSSDVTFVEFLDFECEACRAAFPIVEDLRETYAGEVTFVVRYFPLPGHFNSQRAARAVESAARQDQFEAMYQRMYETQAEWGEAQEPKDALFRTFADDLGLDMDQYDADYASPKVANRVQQDMDDGIELGVQGTPTFYLNGELFQPQTVEDFSTAIDQELDK